MTGMCEPGGLRFVPGFPGRDLVLCATLRAPKPITTKSPGKMETMEMTLVDVFDHSVQPEAAGELRTLIVHDICWMYDTYPDIRKVYRAGMGPNVYEILKQRYDPLLHFGSFNLTTSRTLAYELIWKWTEATGKYVGCPFWSKDAKALFDAEVSSAGGWPIQPILAKKIAKKLSEKGSNGAKCLPKPKLTHEHVYPIKDMKQLLYWNTKRTIEEIRGLFDRYCVGCVVLESEHDQLSADGDDANHWIRYSKAGIKLAHNAAWPDSQRKMIASAGLLTR